MNLLYPRRSAQIRVHCFEAGSETLDRESRYLFAAELRIARKQLFGAAKADESRIGSIRVNPRKSASNVLESMPKPSIQPDHLLPLRRGFQ